MVWLNPLAWLGLVALIAPILIHILVQRRAERFAFPTLRFIQPTRLAAIRRHVLEDLPLLIVRAGILAAAVSALAGPLLVTPARRQAWNARTVRATVAYSAARSEAAQDGSLLQARTFETADLSDGIRRATAWLASAPPARRELLVSAPLAIGSIAQADVSAIPPEIGIRFVRSGTVPAERSFAGTPVLTVGPHRSAGVELRERTVELNGASTTVRESAGALSAAPIEIMAPPEARKGAEAALTAVLSQRVFAPLPGRVARVVFAGSPQFDRAAKFETPTAPWIADAIARIAEDADLQAMNVDGRPSITATSDGPVLVVRTSLPATDLVTLRLLRTVLNALSVGDALQGVPNGILNEILPIPDAQLRAWERPAGEVRTPSLDRLDRDDRRWWWAAVLLLLAIEAWMRRARPARDRADRMPQEAARVA